MTRQTLVSGQPAAVRKRGPRGTALLPWQALRAVQCTRQSGRRRRAHSGHPGRVQCPTTSRRRAGEPIRCTHTAAIEFRWARSVSCASRGIRAWT
jgi:hypothetical protein